MHIYIFESLQIEASYVGDLYFVTKMLSYIFFSKLYGFTLTIRPMIYLEMTCICYDKKFVFTLGIFVCAVTKFEISFLFCSYMYI